ncbi:MAG: peroxiredoxin family protein [Chloroflexi bacterium]|nr:peroxiredoxin family protein [Chloroflexota bacterium]
MRHDYPEFTARQAEVLAIGPEGPRAFARFWAENEMPFPGLADPKHTVADLYGQQVMLLKLGRMPAVLVVDRQGQIRFGQFGQAMSDIPPNADVLALLGRLSGEG